jgi:hypothetical protein
VIAPEVAMRAAVGSALHDSGLAPGGDEESIDDFLVALGKHGYIVTREVNGVHPDAPKE